MSFIQKFEFINWLINRYYKTCSFSADGEECHVLSYGMILKKLKTLQIYVKKRYHEYMCVIFSPYSEHIGVSLSFLSLRQSL